jgi:hypothetical protein
MLGAFSSFGSSLHPDDRPVVLSRPPMSAYVMFECLATDGEYMTVRRAVDEEPFRILWDNLQAVPDPAFVLGDTVMAVVREPPVAVVIHRMEWHFKRDHETYYVTRHGRLSGRRYLPAELRHHVFH